MFFKKKTRSLYSEAAAWFKLRSLFDKIGSGFGCGSGKIAGSGGPGAKKTALLENIRASENTATATFNGTRH